MATPLDVALHTWGPWTSTRWVTAASALVALTGGLTLVLAFGQVVQATVERADARRKALAVHAEASWRCRDLRPALARVQCLERLGPAP
jgi:hypothetical protein